MALAATLLPSGRVRSVMDRITLGLARAGSLTSSETCRNDNKHFNTYIGINLCDKVTTCVNENTENGIGVSTPTEETFEMKRYHLEEGQVNITLQERVLVRMCKTKRGVYNSTKVI